MNYLYIVDFVPHENLRRLRISGFDGEVNLLYERPYEGRSHNYQKELQRFRSPFGNALYKISLNDALGLLSGAISGGIDGEVHFYWGENSSKKQIQRIAHDQEVRRNEILLRAAFMEVVSNESKKLDSQWEAILQEGFLSYSEFKKKYSFPKGLILDFFNQSYVFRQKEAMKKKLIENFFLHGPQHIKIICSEHPKDSIETLLEPAVPIEKADLQQLMLMRQKNCQEIIDLRFDVLYAGAKIGRQAYAKYCEAKCRNCHRAHSIKLEEISFRFFRPSCNVTSYAAIDYFLEYGL
jgi:hypothetical protein